MRIKIDEFMSSIKPGEMTRKKEQCNKGKHIAVWILAIIGAVAAVAAIAYAVYRYMNPDYLEDFDDDFDDYEDDMEDDAEDDATSGTSEQ